MKEVWLVEGGEYSDRYVAAVCSSYEQACGVAVMMGLYEGRTVEMWEAEDEIPPHKLLHSCIVRRGRDSTRPVDVSHDSHPVATDHVAEPKVATSPPGHGYPWARADGYPTAQEAEAAALAAFRVGA